MNFIDLGGIVGLVFFLVTFTKSLGIPNKYAITTLFSKTQVYVIRYTGFFLFLIWLSIFLFSSKEFFTSSANNAEEAANLWKEQSDNILATEDNNQNNAKKLLNKTNAESASGKPMTDADNSSLLQQYLSQQKAYSVNRQANNGADPLSPEIMANADIETGDAEGAVQTLTAALQKKPNDKNLQKLLATAQSQAQSQTQKKKSVANWQMNIPGKMELTPENKKLLGEGGELNPKPLNTEAKPQTRWYQTGSFPIQTDFKDNVDPILMNKSTNLSQVTKLRTVDRGFCEQYKTDLLSREQKCNQLAGDVCSSTNCCVLLGGDKCVAGDQQGPDVKSNYSNFYIKNRDYYYYNGKCYGNCLNGV